MGVRESQGNEFGILLMGQYKYDANFRNPIVRPVDSGDGGNFNEFVILLMGQHKYDVTFY